MKKILIGKITSESGALSAVVEVSVWKVHEKLGKRYRQTKRFLVHNPENQYKLGEQVKIAETRPISAHKSWIIDGAVGTNSPKSAKKKAK